jgi:hypothetical protein
MRTDDNTYPPVTESSIAAAKLAQAADRRRVTELTGVRFDGDRLVLRPHVVDSMLAMMNRFCAAVYGPRGEHRTHEPLALIDPRD